MSVQFLGVQILPRVKISKLLSDVQIPYEEYKELEKNYDMYRVITGQDDSLPKALNYSFLEHILRASTTRTDENALWVTLPKRTVKNFRAMIKIKHKQSPQEAIRALETYEIDLAVFSARHHAFVNILEGAEDYVNTSTLGPNHVGTWPIFNFLDVREVNKTIILYTQETCYMDGYDPSDNEVHVPMIPQSMLNAYRSRLTKPMESKRKVVAPKEKPKPRSTKSTSDCQTPALVKKGHATRMVHGKQVVTGVIYECGIKQEIDQAQAKEEAERLQSSGDQIPSYEPSIRSKKNVGHSLTKVGKSETSSQKPPIKPKARIGYSFAKVSKPEPSFASPVVQSSVNLKQALDQALDHDLELPQDLISELSYQEYEESIKANPLKRREGCCTNPGCSLL